MDDLDVLARDFGFGTRGKSNPMRSSQPDRRPINDSLFSDVYGGPAKYAPSSNSNNNNNNNINKHSPTSGLNYDSIFNSSAAASEAKKTNNTSSKTSSVPVYDKPVYDDDIFDGLPGLKNKSASSTVTFEDDVFASISTPQSSTSVNQNNDFDDLLGNLGRNEKAGENMRSSSAKSSSNSKGFDDLLAGLGSSSSATSRPRSESKQGNVPVAGAKHGSVLDHPFVVLESSSAKTSSSSGVFEDPMQEIGKLGKSRSAKAEASSVSNSEKKIPKDNFQEPPLFDVPNVSTDFQKSFGTASSPQYFETSERQGERSDDIWLTVSEVPLLTQPTAAPPPSRPPPPIPRQTSRSKKSDEFSSTSNYSQHTQSPKTVSQFDELEDFAMGGRSQNSTDESANLSSSEGTNAFSAAAAMKEAMDKAEAKFRHAKEVRERDHAKASRNKESVQMENNEDRHDREYTKTEEREEREKRRLEKERERSREIEREKARQAVERAHREARERSAAQAREKASSEARLKAEKAAVERANAEARERAERSAVQRAQAEARGRAAAEAKERAEKAAAAAKERAASAEVRDKAAVARAEADARRRAERNAVERAAAEARERAAAAAAAASKTNQQRNDDDLESFFGMGRASSAPKGQANSTDPFFDQQVHSKGGSEAAKRASSSSSSGASSNIKKASSTTNIVDDLSSIFGASQPSGEFQEVEGETEERRRARLDRHQRTQERAAKALAEKNQRDLQAQREQEERHRIAETLDIEVKRWAAGKEGNLRALLSTLQYVLWPECGWQPVSLTDLITGASVKKVYRKATLCIHPDKVQQKGATLQQKYIAEKVFDMLKEAWNKFNSEELF